MFFLYPQGLLTLLTASFELWPKEIHTRITTEVLLPTETQVFSNLDLGVCNTSGKNKMSLFTEDRVAQLCYWEIVENETRDRLKQ